MFYVAHRYLSTLLVVHRSVSASGHIWHTNPVDFPRHPKSRRQYLHLRDQELGLVLAMYLLGVFWQTSYVKERTVRALFADMNVVQKCMWRHNSVNGIISLVRTHIVKIPQFRPSFCTACFTVTGFKLWGTTDSGHTALWSSAHSNHFWHISSAMSCSLRGHIGSM